MRANAFSRGLAMISLYFVALAVTLLVEVPIVASFYRRDWSRMGLVAVVTISVLSVVLDIVLARVPLRRDVAISAGQTIAFVVEAAVYARAARGEERGARRALAASAAANLASYLVELFFF